MAASLWGEEFSIESSQETAKKIKKKTANKKEAVVSVEKIIKSKSKNVSVDEKLLLIESEVNRILGKYKSQTQVIKTKDELVDYIDHAIGNGIIAIDTETNNSLDPFTCKLMGPCLYTPGLKNAYIPINHVNKDTGERLEWQLTEENIKEQFDRLKDTKIIFHNSKFDCKVLKFTCGLDLSIYWDTQTGSRMLNENESARLKDQYRDKIDPTQEKYDIDHLFNGIEYALVPPELFSLYAATDSFLTYKLYEYQKKEFEKPGNERLYKVFSEVEIPVIKVFMSMEVTGISIDEEYSKRLAVKYHNKLDQISQKISEELFRLNPTIEAWKNSPEAHTKTVDKKGKEAAKEKVEQLSNPIALTSSTQLAILLYDILKAPVTDKKNPRGTGSEILTALEKKIPLCALMLEQRTILKLLEAFIDSLPAQRYAKDGKIHTKFNPIGADTGRVSNQEPNLQQIPAKNKEIRMLFTADSGKVLVGADFSQQEPRLLAGYSGDQKMIESYKNDKDLYAVMGTAVYNNNYEDNLEHYPDGSKYEAGTKRRKAMKAVLLGIMYGMGPAALAERIGVSTQEARDIIGNFFNGFKGVEAWVQKGENFVKENGYVEDFWGRRRRLPDAMLQEWVAKSTESVFNPILGVIESYRPSKLEDEFLLKIKNARFKADVDRVIAEAKAKGITLSGNSQRISRALRQCTNARIQGSASTMTKKAMINIYNDKAIHDLGFELLIAVHDELIGQCPEENAEKVAERLSYLMSNCVPDVPVPFKCDAEIEKRWYQNTYEAMIKGEYTEALKEFNGDKVKAFNKIFTDHIECTEKELKIFCGL